MFCFYPHCIHTQDALPQGGASPGFCYSLSPALVMTFCLTLLHRARGRDHNRGPPRWACERYTRWTDNGVSLGEAGHPHKWSQLSAKVSPDCTWLVLGDGAQGMANWYGRERTSPFNPHSRAGPYLFWPAVHVLNSRSFLVSSLWDFFFLKTQMTENSPSQLFLRTGCRHWLSIFQAFIDPN